MRQTAMQYPVAFVKPRKRRALTGLQTVVGVLFAPFLIAVLMLPSLLFDSLIPELTPKGLIWIVLGAVVLICAIALVSHYVPARPVREVESAIKQDRAVKIEGGDLLQIVDGEVSCSIDATREFEYAVLDRYDLENALFALYQDKTTLEFRISDTGGAEAVSKVLQISWPPPNVSAGRIG